MELTRIGTIALAAAALFAAAAAPAVQIEQGDLLVTDSANARVLLVDPATGAVTPFSPRTGSGTNLLFAPAGIAIDPDGAIFVADSFADRVVQIDPTTGTQSVLHDWSSQFGDFGPAAVGSAPQGIDLEDTIAGFDARDLFVASADGVYRVSRDALGGASSLLSGAADLQLGTDVAVQEDLGDPYSLWVVANGVLVRWYFADGTTQALTASDARNVAGVEFAQGTPLFTRSQCYQASSLNGLFVFDGTFGGTQLEYNGFASCLGRPLAVASPTLIYGTYADTQVVALVPQISGYGASVVATLPQGDVAPIAADLAVSPVTFPAPEPERLALAAAALSTVAAMRRRRARGRRGNRGKSMSKRTLVFACAALALASIGTPRVAAALRTGDLLVIAGGVVVRIDSGTGSIHDFSPRTGSGTNLLSSPSDIASDPEGEVFVVDMGKLIQIDVATGAQHEVRAFNPQIIGDYPLDLGSSPWGVAVSPVAPSGLNGRSVFVGSHGALYEVVRDAFLGTYSSLFGSFANGWENYLGQSVSIEDLGGGNVAAWVGTIGAILEGTGTPLLALYTEQTGTILGTRRAADIVFTSRTFGTYCTDFPNDNGVYAFYYEGFVSSYIMHTFASGGDLSCRGPIAATEQPFALYVADRSQVPNRIVKVTGLQSPQTSPVATLPGSQVAVSLAVYAPEPTADFAMGTSLAALLALLARRTRSRAID